MNGKIESYHGKDWLSYLGVLLEHGKAEECLDARTSSRKYSGTTINRTVLSMAGTKATFLFGIEMNGVALSVSSLHDSRGKHDFSTGSYCMKVVRKKAFGVLLFAIDRS